MSFSVMVTTLGISLLFVIVAIVMVVFMGGPKKRDKE